jgi:hypothetical protein
MFWWNQAAINIKKKYHGVSINYPNLGPEACSFSVLDCSTNVSGTHIPPSLVKILVKPLSREFITLITSVSNIT